MSYGSSSNPGVGTAVEESIKVVCRFRPQNDSELNGGSGICVDIPKGSDTITMQTAYDSSQPAQKFTFDKVFRWDSSQKEVYEYAAKPIVNAVLQGFNGTVFAYGQTASGKTYTMEGPDIEDKFSQGVIPRMVWSLFDGICHAEEHMEFLVRVSIVDIYNERIRDLLDPKKDNLRIHEDKTRGVFIGEVTELYIQCEQEIFDAMRAGHYNRAVAVTNMNEHSSRSHLLFMLTLEQKNTIDRSLKVGKLHLVDLAGSEKVAKTGASGERLDEAKNINKSLSALGNVINALTDKKCTHVPYRDSKLTRVLQESLGGNSKTTLIITCSPSSFNEQETLSTLRFGGRAKMIKNSARVNQERSLEELKLLLANSDRCLQEERVKCHRLTWLLEQNGIALPANMDAIPLPSAGSGGAVDLASEAAEVKEQIKDLQDENEELKRKARENDEEMRRMQKQMADLSQGRDSYNYQVGEQNDEVEILRVEKRRLEEEVEHLQQTNKNLITAKEQAGDGRIGELESQLAGEQGKINDLQERLKDAKDVDRPLKRKVSQLDKNLEQLTVMYHKLVSQNSGLKVECQVNEKKIQRKEQRIGQLERNLREAKQKYEKLLTQCANLTAAMDVMGRSKTPSNVSASGDGSGQASVSGSNHPRRSNIVRPMKGGFSRKAPQDGGGSDSPREL